MNHSLAIAFSALLVVGCASPTASQTSAAPRSAPPSIAASDTVGRSAEPEGVWTPVPMAANGIRGYPTAVVVTDDEVVATGSLLGIEHATAVAWASRDTVSWTQRLRGGDDSGPTSLTTWGDRMIAVGKIDGAPCPLDQAVAIWIRSADGIWQEAPFKPLFCNGADPSATASADHAVIVGGDPDTSEGFAWSSTDGFGWTKQPVVFPVGPAPRVSKLSRGGFIASGSDVGNDEAWASRSVDGIVWEQPRSLAVPPGGVVIAQTEGADGVRLLVGFPDDRALVIATPDGSNWQSAAVDGLFVPDLLSIHTYARGLIATGVGEFTAKIAVSVDGRHWRAVPAPPGVASDGVIGGGIFGGRAVLVGFVEPDGNRVPVAWVGPESLLAP